MGVRSFVILPLMIARAGTPLGALSFATLRAERPALEGLVPRLQLVAQVVASTLARRRADEALRESERRFRTAFMLSPDAFYLVTLEGRFVQCNDAFCKMLGYERHELGGRTSLELGVFADPADRAALLSRLTRDGQVSDLELTLRRKDGSTFAGALSVSAVTVGGVPHALGAIRDVTERIRIEEERRELQTSLAQSDRLASMGMLAAGVAHEINNPLSFVLYNIESACEDLAQLVESARAPGAPRPALPDDLAPAEIDDIVTRLKEALSGTQRIKQIARSLGTFSRVERVAVQPIDVRESVQHAVTMANNELKYRARLIRDLGPTPLVMASEGKLAQVFLNLLINAAHAIPEGHVEQNEVSVRSHTDGAWACVEVKDSGSGIPPEVVARVFEPFFSTKGPGLGTGLGLTISKQLIEEVGGEVRVESEVGRGTRVLVRLPAAPSALRPGPRASRAPASTGVPRGRILVVDDEPGVRAVLGRILGREHDVVACGSGRDARRILERDQSFDLVFCDLMMPDTSGMELHSWLATENPGLAARFVFITGGAFSPGAAEYLARVGNPRLEKPVEVAPLSRMARELMACRR